MSTPFIDLPGLRFPHGDDIAALRNAVQQFAQAEQNDMPWPSGHMFV